MALVQPRRVGRERLRAVLAGSPGPIREGTVLTTGDQPGTYEALATSGNELMQQLNKLSTEFTEIADKVNRGEGTAGKLITDDQLYSNVNQLSSETVKLIYDFRQNPRKYLTIKFELF